MLINAYWNWNPWSNVKLIAVHVSDTPKYEKQNDSWTVQHTADQFIVYLIQYRKNKKTGNVQFKEIRVGVFPKDHLPTLSDFKDIESYNAAT